MWEMPSISVKARWKRAGMEDKRMKRVYAILLALSLLTLTACGGGMMNQAMSGGDAGEFGSMASSPSADDAGGAEYGFYDMDMPMEEAETKAESNGQTEAPDRLKNAKMIYTARLEVETTDFQTCAQAIEDQAGKLGGYLESAEVNSYNSGYRSGNYVVRVPAESFGTFLKAVGEIGHVVYQQKDSQNISEMYYDTESRLTTQRTKLERLQTLLAQAENMEDLITIESAIAETELAIEQLTGELRHYDALVDFATVTVSLEEVVRLSTVETAPPGFMERLGQSFADGLTNFGDFLQELTIALAYSWIWLLILVAVVILLVRRAKKKSPFRRKKERNQNIPDTEKNDDKEP